MDLDNLESLQKMKVPELRNIAREYGILGLSKSRKKDIVEVLTDKLTKIVVDSPPSPPPSPPVSDEEVEPPSPPPKKKRVYKKKVQECIIKE